MFLVLNNHPIKKRAQHTRAGPPRRSHPELLKLLKGIEPGDVVTVTRIDRRARSTFDLFAIVKRIVDAGALFRSLVDFSNIL